MCRVSSKSGGGGCTKHPSSIRERDVCPFLQLVRRVGTLIDGTTCTQIQNTWVHVCRVINSLTVSSTDGDGPQTYCHPPLPSLLPPPPTLALHWPAAQRRARCGGASAASAGLSVPGLCSWSGGGVGVRYMGWRGGGGVWIRARTHTKPNSGKTGSARRKIKMDEGTVRPKGKKNLQHKASEKVWLWVASAVSQF